MLLVIVLEDLLQALYSVTGRLHNINISYDVNSWLSERNKKLFGLVDVAVITDNIIISQNYSRIVPKMSTPAWYADLVCSYVVLVSLLLCRYISLLF
jgi:hypothetical protein